MKVPAIEPMAKWLVVKHANHSAIKAVSPAVVYVQNRELKERNQS